MKPVYLDTSALMRRAEAAVASPTARNLRVGAPVAALLSGSGRPVATSEVGLLEFHDIVTKHLRSTEPDLQQCDEAWADSAISQVMNDIGSNRLQIRAVAPHAYEQAMTLVTLATRVHGRKFRVWDAVHLVTATAWATELETQVELWTTDTDFVGFAEVFHHFEAVIGIRNLDDL